MHGETLDLLFRCALSRGLTTRTSRLRHRSFEFLSNFRRENSRDGDQRWVSVIHRHLQQRERIGLWVVVQRWVLGYEEDNSHCLVDQRWRWEADVRSRDREGPGYQRKKAECILDTTLPTQRCPMLTLVLITVAVVLPSPSRTCFKTSSAILSFLFLSFSTFSAVR